MMYSLDISFVLNFVTQLNLIHFQNQLVQKHVNPTWTRKKLEENLIDKNLKNLKHE